MSRKTSITFQDIRILYNLFVGNSYFTFIRYFKKTHSEVKTEVLKCSKNQKDRKPKDRIVENARFSHNN